MAESFPLSANSHSLSHPDFSQLMQIFEDLLKTEEVDTFAEIVSKIIYNFMLPKEKWDKIYNYLDERKSHSILKKLNQQAIFQFYYYKDEGSERLFDNVSSGKIWDRKRETTIDIWTVNFRAQDLAMSNEVLIKDLKFPNASLKEMWRLYESTACCSPSKEIVKIYHQMLGLFEKLKSLDKNSDEYWNLIQDFNDGEFVKHNFEDSLSKDLKNIKLWNKYFKYLEKHDTQVLLETYSKYCRVFFDDKEMKEIYKAAVQQFNQQGAVFVVPWHNRYEFERFDENFHAKHPNSQNLQKVEELLPEPCKFYFTHKNAKSQNFAFRDTLICYIQKSANANVQLKLASTCKFFHIKFPCFVACKFIVTNFWGPKLRFHQQSVFIGSDQIENVPFKNIYISTALRFHSSDSYFMSKLIKQMVYCSAKYLEFLSTKQILTFEELKFLIGHGNVIVLDLGETKIFDASGDPVPLQDILMLIPRIEKFLWYSTQITPNTLPEILKISFKTKIENFALRSVKIDNFDSTLFSQFLIKNASSNCYCRIQFVVEQIQNVPELREKCILFKKAIEKTIEENWKKENEKPHFQIDDGVF